MGVTIIVATFGSDIWRDRAQRIAVPSALQASPDELIVHHGPTQDLADARNSAAKVATEEWLCFLDADDQLESGYLKTLLNGAGDLRAPAVRYIIGGQPEPPPMLYSERDIDYINPCVIGTLVRREMFDDVGGFWPEKAWEDWSLFRRCWLIGAVIVHHPAAVYRVNVNQSGRNNAVAGDRLLHRSIVLSHEIWHRKRKARNANPAV